MIAAELCGRGAHRSKFFIACPGFVILDAYYNDFDAACRCAAPTVQNGALNLWDMADRDWTATQPWFILCLDLTLAEAQVPRTSRMDAVILSTGIIFFAESLDCESREDRKPDRRVELRAAWPKFRRQSITRRAPQ
ncbi:hypothetical protein [Methylovirgula sp. HY1]|uniref:hypothetical protein n=1 Tax=Methylovirgula sp. HY1 TaxID=2822761 RepID=UPI001C5A8498|nr:hypothetical protein [Methylovirgula sp. HY1]